VDRVTELLAGIEHFYSQTVVLVGWWVSSSTTLGQRSVAGATPQDQDIMNNETNQHLVNRTERPDSAVNS